MRDDPPDEDPSGGATPADPGVPRRVWSATSLLIAGRVWGSATTFACLALLARHLEDEGFGQYTFYLALFALLDSLTDFGTGQVAVQRTASDRWAVVPVLMAARRIRAVMALAGMGVVALGLWISGEEGAGWILAASLYELTHVLELSATVFKRKIAWGIPVAVRAVASGLRLALVLILLGLGVESAAVFLFGTALGSALANGLLHRAALPHLPKPTIPVQPARGILRQAAPLGIAALCQQLYFYVDNVFVRAIEGDGPLGRYNAGVRLLSFLIMGALYATTAALPWLAKRHERGDLGDAAARLAQPLFAAAGLGAGLLVPHTALVLRLLFGEGYGDAAAPFAWLLGGMVAIYAGAPLLTAVVSTGRSRAVLAVAAIALGVNLIGNTLLVPPRGIEGAAIATFLTELAVLVGGAVCLVRAGASPLAHRPLRWLGGPLAFAIGYLVSSAIPSAGPVG